MIKEIVLASKNQGKLKELREMVSDSKIKILSLDDFPEIPEIIEDGKTFKENAFKKASQVANYTDKIALSDDSGLEVFALGGSPGVESARFAKNDQERIEKLLKIMEGEKDRRAKFCCVIAVAKPKGEVKAVEGEIKGFISERPQGFYGFGYDPIFIPDGYYQTFAEMTAKEKNKISHRAKALAKAKEVLREMQR
ncbi:MAG: XTP/dITP diphosphatase [bacterium]